MDPFTCANIKGLISTFNDNLKGYQAKTWAYFSYICIHHLFTRIYYHLQTTA